jgi:tetratricopeptide (TPR) repeat protein
MGLCGNAGDLTESLRRADDVIQLSQRDPDLGADLLGYSPYLFLLGLRGAYLAWAGRCHQGELDLQQALAAARQRDDPLNCMVAQLMYVELHEATGVAPGALAHARESLELTEKMANHAGRVIANREMGVAYILNEDWDDALSALNRALAIAHEHETGLHYEAAILVNLARVHGELGHASEALALAKQAVEVAQRSGTKFREVQAEIEWARALSTEGRAGLRTEIDGHLDAASRLVEETGGESQRPMIREVRAKSARGLGDHAQYDRELREARRLYTEMGATGHAERLARELGL